MRGALDAIASFSPWIGARWRYNKTSPKGTSPLSYSAHIHDGEELASLSSVFPQRFTLKIDRHGSQVDGHTDANYYDGFDERSV